MGKLKISKKTYYKNQEIIIKKSVSQWKFSWLLKNKTLSKVNSQKYKQKSWMKSFKVSKVKIIKKKIKSGKEEQTEIWSVKILNFKNWKKEPLIKGKICQGLKLINYFKNL